MKTSSSTTTRNIQVVRLISKSRNTIYEAKDVETNEHFALKLFKFKEGKVALDYRIEKRFRFLDHENVIRIDDCVDQRQFQKGDSENGYSSYILTELARFGNFSEIINECEDDFEFSDPMARTYFKQLIDGLEHLHSQGVAHLDIKPENLLLGVGKKNGDYCLKIADFDMSHIDGDKTLCGRGTRDYRAPELINADLRSTELDYNAMDIFSIGVFLFTLRFGYLPFCENREVANLDLFNLLQENPNKFWKFHQQQNQKNYIPESFKELFSAMCSKNPSDRPTIEQIREFRWTKSGSFYKKDELKEKMDVLYQ